MDVNNYQILSNEYLQDSNNLISLCLCCSKGSYNILALNINNMDRCCLSKMYSLRTSTINNQY
jgi:hypothetical protein